MEVLVQPDIWDSDDEEEIQAAIDQVAELIGMSPCSCLTSGGTSITRIQLDVIIANDNLIIFEAGGLAALAPDRPDTSFSEDSGDTGEEVGMRRVALCWACRDFVASVAEKGILQGLDIQPAITLASLGLSFIFGPFIGVGFGLVTQAVILGVTEFINGDDDVEQVACCLYETLLGQTVNEANFAAGLDNCPDVSGTGAGWLLSLCRAAIDDTSSWFSFVKSLGAYMGAVDSLSSCFCPSEPGCFSDFTIDNGDWHAVAASAVYSAGNGWGPSASGGNNHRIIIGYTHTEDFTLTEVRVTCTNDDDENWNWQLSTRDEFEVVIDNIVVELPQGTTEHTFVLSGATNIRDVRARVDAIEGIQDRIEGRIVLFEITDGDCVLPIQPV